MSQQVERSCHPSPGIRLAYVVADRAGSLHTGPYPNNTNVRQDSDVDVVVELQECQYYDYLPGVVQANHPGSPYKGGWTPAKWRDEVLKAMVACFGASQVDATGKIAINIKAVAGSRPSADVVPSFDYVRYDDMYGICKHSGSCVFPADGGLKVVNYPQQQLDNGRAKNNRTGGRYKFFVRALKNAENLLCTNGTITDLPSYFMECLIYNVSDATLQTGNLEQGFRATLYELWTLLDATPTDTMQEPNELKWLFKGHSKWSVADAKSFVLHTSSYLGYGD